MHPASCPVGLGLIQLAGGAGRRRRAEPAADGHETPTLRSWRLLVVLVSLTIMALAGGAAAGPPLRSRPVARDQKCGRYPLAYLDAYVIRFKSYTPPEGWSAD